MRSIVLAFLLIGSLLLAGCGGSDGPTTAGAGGGPSGPPGGPPGGPPDGGDGGAAQESAPPENSAPPGGEEGLPQPTSPDGQPGALPSPGSPDGGTPPPEGAPPDGGQPPEELNPDGTPRRPPRPQTLHEQALAAFRDGNDAQAMRLLNAHYVVVADAKQDLAQKMAWFPALTRPALGPRIGIAVQYNEASVPKDFRGDPMPIGSAELKSAVEQWQQNASTERGIGGTGRTSRFGGGGGGGGGGDGGGGGRRGEGSGEGGSDSMRNATGPAQLSYYTGDIGEMLLEALQERFQAGEYGLAMQELFQDASRARRARREDGQDPQLAGGEQTSAGGADEGGSRRGRQGEGGEAGAGEGRTRRWSSKSGSPEAVSLEQVRQLNPCILWLGKEDARDLILKRAEAAKVDILVICDMTVRESRGGDFISNTTSLRVLMTKANKPVPNYKAEPLVNKTVEEWRQKGERGVDPVEREITKVIEALDGVLKPAALPEALTAERAKKRISDLVAEKPADSLPVLVEARFYVGKGLLPEDDFRSAAVSLLGQKGYADLQAKAKIGQE